MLGYVIGELTVTDPDVFARYIPLATESIARHGGRYIVRGGEASSLEDDQAPGIMVALEFPSLDAARRWYGSPDYQVALKLRLASAKGRVVLVEGGA